jgi:hypothetical protein
MFIKDGMIFQNVGQLKQLHPTVSFGPNTPFELGYETYYPPKPNYQEEIPEVVDIKVALAQAVEDHLNAKANEYRYKDYHAAMAYINSPVEKFKNEAEAFMAWVSYVWAHVDTVEADIVSGRREIPTAVSLIEELPKFSPPEQ